MDELLYTVWLSLACTPGSETFAKLLKKFNTAEAIYNVCDKEIASCITTRSRDYTALTDKNLDRANLVLDFCKKKHVGMLSYFDRDYPSLLKDIKNPPVLLYYRGILPEFDREFTIAVVGMRKLSQYGRKNTFTVAHDLARAGAVVVSGMATGIDGVALAAAISAGKPTVAVIGSGIDVCYPSQHLRLAKEIVKRGCVITEYAPGTRPEKQNFPVRNRIISGLSRVTLVMEGEERSGALITARHAREQDRPVYAFPGNVGNRGSEASNLLIKNGAKLFTAADDILRDFEIRSSGRLDPFALSRPTSVDMAAVIRNLEVSCVAPNDDVFYVKKASPKSKEQNAPIEPKSRAEDDSVNEEKISVAFDRSILALYKKIPIEGDVSIDDLADGEHSLRDVMQGLLTLEISNFVTMLPGDRVKRNI